MRPIRQTCRRTGRGRRPPRCRTRRAAGRRSGASSRPAGSRAVVSSGSRWPSGAMSSKPERGQRRPGASRRRRRGGPRPPRGLRRAAGRGRRGGRRSSRPGRCGGSGGRPAGRRRAVRGRGTTTGTAPTRASIRATGPLGEASPAPGRGARRGTSGCRSSRRRSPHPSTSSGMPPSEVTVSTQQERVGLLRGPRGVRCRCGRRSTSRRARPPPASSPGPGAARRGAARGRGPRPTAASTRTTSAPTRRATSHIRSPKKPLTPTMTGVARLEQVDEAGLHAGRARPRDGEGEPVGRLEDGPQPVAGLVEEIEELGVEMAEDGPGQRRHHLGVGVRRAGAEEQQFRDARSHRSGPGCS